MRFHLVGLPFTNTTDEFPACAFTSKVRGFAQMMTQAGHTVYLYGGEQNTAPCHEHIPLMTEQEREGFLNGQHYTLASFDNSQPHWIRYNDRAAQAIAKRAKRQDFICLIGGLAQQPIADALPHLMAVEFGIGYPGTFAKFRVFESYAWMHSVYGTTTTNPAALDGRWFDAVIPGYVNEQDFTLGDGTGDELGEYYFFLGRLIERKGYQIAADVAQHLGKRIIIAGVGTPPSYGEYVGPVGLERVKLFQQAAATFVPTTYVEPFGTVNVESQMCGTPVITTDWGAFPETVAEGVSGYRCRTFGEFVEAALSAPTLDRGAIRQRAVAEYGYEVTTRRYERYFQRLLSLWGDGWYAA
jgi:glycosyltransferase involved in cell wall biosynthesis